MLYISQKPDAAENAARREAKTLLGTAYHEAGHAVAAHSYGGISQSVSIIPTEGNLGLTEYLLPWAYRDRPPYSLRKPITKPQMDRLKSHPLSPKRREVCFREIVINFAGAAAEARATRTSFSRKWFGVAASLDNCYAYALAEYVCRGEEDYMDLCMCAEIEARGLVRQSWSQVEALADALLRDRHIEFGPTQVKSFFGSIHRNYDLREPVLSWSEAWGGPMLPPPLARAA